MGLALCWFGLVGLNWFGLVWFDLFVCLLQMLFLWFQLEPCPSSRLGFFFFFWESKDLYAVKCKCEGAVQGRLRAL